MKWVCFCVITSNQKPPCFTINESHHCITSALLHIYNSFAYLPFICISTTHLHLFHSFAYTTTWWSLMKAWLPTVMSVPVKPLALCTMSPVVTDPIVIFSTSFTSHYSVLFVCRHLSKVANKKHMVILRTHFWLLR